MRAGERGEGWTLKDTKKSKPTPAIDGRNQRQLHRSVPPKMKKSPPIIAIKKSIESERAHTHTHTHSRLPRQLRSHLHKQLHRSHVSLTLFCDYQRKQLSRLQSQAMYIDCITCNDSSLLVRTQGSSFSTIPTVNEMISTSASKKSGSSESRNDRTVPSSKSASKEQQAGKRKDLDSKISNPTFAQRSSTNDSSTCSTFSQKNARIVK